MSEPFIGEIRMFGGNFAPRGWAFCDGQLLAISSNTALFSLLGTIYGGDGRTTFALPDLRGRVAMHAGSGPGLTNRQIGQRGGAEKLSSGMLPDHSHTLNAASGAATSGVPTNNLPARSRLSVYAPASNPPAVMSQEAISGGGSANPAEAMPPYQVVSYIIALQGLFPSRS